MSQNEKDYLELKEYIEHLFKKDYINAKIMKQIQNYRNTYKYSYSGIKKCLQWWYEKNKHTIEDANEGIGIVPFIYEQVQDYYYKIYKAQEINSNYDIKNYKPKNKLQELALTLKRHIKEFKLLEEEE